MKLFEVSNIILYLNRCEVLHSFIVFEEVRCRALVFLDIDSIKDDVKCLLDSIEFNICSSLVCQTISDLSRQCAANVGSSSTDLAGDKRSKGEFGAACSAFLGSKGNGHGSAEVGNTSAESSVTVRNFSADGSAEVVASVEYYSGNVVSHCSA